MANDKKQRQDNLDVGLEPLTSHRLVGADRAIHSIAITMKRLADMAQWDFERRKKYEEERDADRGSRTSL